VLLVVVNVAVVIIMATRILTIRTIHRRHGVRECGGGNTIIMSSSNSNSSSSSSSSMSIQTSLGLTMYIVLARNGLILLQQRVNLFRRGRMTFPTRLCRKGTEPR
jgi:hypothetical protein